MADVKERADIALADQWNLEDIINGTQRWEELFAEIKAYPPQFAAYASKLNEAAVLQSALDLYTDVSEKLERLFIYARMHRDEDNANTTYQAMSDRAQMVAVEWGAATAFLAPEILQIPEAQLNAWVQADLLPYARFLSELTRQRAHILTPAEEALLAQLGEVLSTADEVFTMFDDADLRFPTIKDEKGQDVEITHGRYLLLMESHDRRVRKDAFTGLYDTFAAWKNTLATTYAGSVKKDIAMARIRKYDSARQAVMDDENVPEPVYDSLVEAVNRHLPAMHKYIGLRKQSLGLDELHMYDIYVPLVQDIDRQFTYQEAQAMVAEGLKPLGNPYLADMAAAYTDRWIDVYENRGKTSGAYSWGTYNAHPYVLLNYQGRLDDVFTLAHELGHAMHSYYSNKHQSFLNAGYGLFLAEVASTTNESLLIEHMLRQNNDKEFRKYLLNHYLEQFRGTVYRQTMFAEFERDVHAMVERGEPATAENMYAMYKALNEKYYGLGMISDDAIGYEWSRIPHFYRAFYVYKYATGFSAAVALADGILKEGSPAVERYMQFLSAGCSKDPLDILRSAGVDMTTPQPVETALQTFGRLVDELAALG